MIPLIRAGPMSGIRSAILVIAIGLMATPGIALGQGPADSTPKADPEKQPKPPPIAFFLAKGEPDACGAGCSEWIAADGTIDQAAPQRLRALLQRLGKRKLPIYFHSPGGSVEGAIEIGRLMRARGMTAGVARTIPQGCDRSRDRESACDALKRSGRELPAELRTVRTLCNSSCVYALIGAARARSRPARSSACTPPSSSPTTATAAHPPRRLRRVSRLRRSRGRMSGSSAT